MELEATARELLGRHEVPGVAVGWVAGDGTTQIATAGDRGDGCGAVEDDTIFAAASLTKPVFATAVMSLVDEGRIELDRPLSDYLADPYLADDDRALSITARMVLSHTTGFPNWRGDEPLFLRWLPGTRWGYSGEGYSYLQHVVEHLTGSSLDDVMTDAVLRPLGMSDSTLGWRHVDASRLAVGHAADGNPWPPFRPPQAKAAAGALFTTVSDYLRFLIHALNCEHQMFEPQVRIDDELAWGLGWGIEHTKVGRAVWQWGDDPGYKNFVIADPDDRQGVVVFTNGDLGGAAYTEVVRHVLAGEHPALDVWNRSSWIGSWTLPQHRS